MLKLDLIRKYLLLGLLVSLATACAGEENSVELGGREFTVDLALTREAQARGLMFVEHMPADHGMLFVFNDDIPRSFWMKNTKIPLDIFYFDHDLALVSVARNARPCKVARCPGYPSDGPARYVLELNSGLADQLGIQTGDRLVLKLDPAVADLPQ